eukprot:scaffold9345_cov70-Phaeocystis_antarctica.AAC.2
MQGCTVTRPAVDLGCSLDRHDLSASRHCEFDAERRPEICAARIQLAVDERPKFLCPLGKSRTQRCVTQPCIRLLRHLDGHLQLETPPARAQRGRAVQPLPLGDEPAPLFDGRHLHID